MLKAGGGDVFGGGEDEVVVLVVVDLVDAQEFGGGEGGVGEVDDVAGLEGEAEDVGGPFVLPI